eukprot:1143439-Pelagomonas_calceolata.AAC.3
MHPCSPQTTDSNVRGAIVIDVVIGAVLLLLFIIFQSRSILTLQEMKGKGGVAAVPAEDGVLATTKRGKGP